MGPLLVLALLAWAVGFGLASAHEARSIDRNAAVWFGFGAILGPVAWLLLQAAPPGHCHTCGTPTRGWLRVCGWCGEDVASVPHSTIAIITRMTGADAATVPAPAFRHEAEPSSERATAPRTSIGTRRPGEKRPATPTSRPLPPHSGPAIVVSAAVPRVASSPAPPRAQIVRTADESGNGFHPDVAQATTVDQTRTASRSTATETRSTGTESGSTGTELRVLATAIYVVGTGQLEPGRRYGLAINGSRFQLLGPVDVDDSKVVLDRPIAECDASAVEGRLMVSGPSGRSGFAMAFMSVSGPSTEALSESIRSAARSAGSA